MTRTIFALTVLALLLGSFAILQAHSLRLPGDHTGYEPAQPIAFSHAMHAGTLSVPCLYCHADAERSRHAGIPAVGTCMNCHRFVTAPWDQVKTEMDKAAAENRPAAPVISPEIRKIYRALGLNDALQPDPGLKPASIRWIKVHNLPDFVFFDHSRHVNGGVACENCHGDPRTMARIRQEQPLSMGWCVNCHRTQNAQAVQRGGKPPASTDCAVCHY